MKNKPNQYLRKLREGLPYGAIKEIAKRTGYHRVYVGYVLKGKRQNKEIIDEAISVRSEHIKKQEEMEKKLKNALKGGSK